MSNAPNSEGDPPNPEGQSLPGGPGASRLTPGHAFDFFDLRTVDVAGADGAIEMEITPQVVNGSGVLQGGLMATLIDLVAGTTLLRGELPHQRGTTSELHISFLDAARVGPVRATAHVLRRGKRSAVVRVDVHDLGADDLYVATATLTFAVQPVTGSSDPAR
jgi:uncharacterized protein (TIGR00369 family)